MKRLTWWDNIRDQTWHNVFGALLRLDATTILMVLMLLLGIALELDIANSLVTWTAQRTIFTPHFWKWAFFAGAILIAFFRPGVSFWGFVFISPVLALFWYVFQYTASRPTPSLFWLVVIGFCLFIVFIFYWRSAVVNSLLETVVQLRLENKALKEELAKVKKPDEQPQ